MLDKSERNVTIFLKPDLYAWLIERAKQNSRARCREISTILEAERNREMRRRNPVLGAKGAQ